MWKNNKFNFKYSSQKTDEIPNKAIKFARNMYANQLDRYNDEINKDYKKILDNGCIYLPNYFEKTNDRKIFNELKKELDNNGCKMVQWSKHFKFENPDFLPTFNTIIDKMAKYFNVDVCQTRLNYYPDNHSYKPMHKDRNAYQINCKENFTMGASFGNTRELQFIHDQTKCNFKFPQNNGDIFAFNSEINKKFMHGVPKISKYVGPRFSIIAWASCRQKNNTVN